MPNKQELILSRFSKLWQEHPEWSFGKLITVIIGLNDIDHQLFHISDEDLFRRIVSLKKNSNAYQLVELPEPMHGLTKEIVFLLNELIETIRAQKFDDYRSEKYEILVAYALFQDELKFMKKHLEGKL